MTAVSRITEDLAAASAVAKTRSESCACGGIIVAPDLNPMIAAAVAAHVVTIQHRRWAVQQGFLAANRPALTARRA